jgi:hypothetical protein
VKQPAPNLGENWRAKGVLCEEDTRSIVCRKSVTGQRSNQLNYVPNLFSYLYRKPACLVAFLRFNRFACVAYFNPVEPNSEVNGHHGHQAKPLSKNCATGNTNPEQLSLPRQ